MNQLWDLFVSLCALLRIVVYLCYGGAGLWCFWKGGAANERKATLFLVIAFFLR